MGEEGVLLTEPVESACVPFPCVTMHVLVTLTSLDQHFQACMDIW
jgi:hypothetical protein